MRSFAKLPGVPNTNPESAKVDPAAARRRLAAFIRAEPYRPDLLCKAARLSIKLQETAQAGRWWLLSDASGDEVDAAVEVFAETCQRLPRLMASELPRFSHDWELEAYAAPARARIERYGLGEELSRRAPRQRVRPRWELTAVGLAGLVALLVLGAVLVLLGRR